MAAGMCGCGNSKASLWQSANVPLEHVDTAAIVSPAAKPDARSANTVEEPSASGRVRWGFDYSNKAMLFADAVGYARLSEQQSCC